MSTNQYPPGFVHSHSLDAQYQADPLALYQYLSTNRSNTLLLESAEILDKRALKSLILVDTAVKIECFGEEVSITAKTLNGEAVIEFLQQRFARAKYHHKVTFQASAKDFLRLRFSTQSQPLDELSRLKSTNPIQVLREVQSIDAVGQHPFAVFLGGAFAFDLISIAEELPDVKDSDNNCPDYVFYLAETLLIIDHQKQTTEVVANIFSGQAQQQCHEQLLQQIALLQNVCARPFVLNTLDLSLTKTQPLPQEDISDQTFCQQVESLKEHIRAGDIFQIVPSRTFSLPCSQPVKAYQALKQTNPSPYMFYLKDDNFVLFGASPESALKFTQQNRQVELYPIAGTRPRGFKDNGEYNLDLDGRIELELRNDVKEMILRGSL